MTGPSIPPTATVEPRNPMAFPRSRAPNERNTMEVDTLKSMDAPMPWTTRKTINCPRSADRAHSSDAAVKAARPTVNILACPVRSDTLPATIRKHVWVSR